MFEVGSGNSEVGIRKAEGGKTEDERLRRWEGEMKSGLSDED
jgi:hypothetical protein